MKQYTNQTLIQLLWWIFFYGNIFLNPAYSMQMKATRPIRHYPVIPSNTSMTIQAHREHGNECAVVNRLERRDKILPWMSDGVKSGLASGLATALVKTILQPFDTIKTIQQAERFRLTPWQAGVQLFKSRGLAGLWSGTGISVVGSSPSTAVYFGIYSSLKKLLSNYIPMKYNLLSVGISASIGNTIASFLRVPNEVIKQRLQAGVHASLWEALQYSFKTEGFFGIYGGGRLMSQIVRDVPYAILTLMAYEVLQSIATKLLNDHLAKSNQVIAGSSKGIKDAVCGAMAGGISSYLTCPMDVIKTRMMTASDYSSISDAFFRITREEGLHTFFAGATPRLMHKIPANGLFFLCYEFFKTILGVTPTAHSK